ncbi:MAG: hypothetical protein WCB96_05870 [Candidatus Aminicenantales bacterium]
MTKRFQNFHFHISEKDAKGMLRELTGPRTVRRDGEAFAARPTFHNNEAAARFFLSKFLEKDSRPVFRSLAAPERPEVVPDMHLVSEQNVPQTKTHIMRFEQSQAKIPIFGSMALVELDRNLGLVSIDAEIAEVKGVLP